MAIDTDDNVKTVIAKEAKAEAVTVEAFQSKDTEYAGIVEAIRDSSRKEIAEMHSGFESLKSAISQRYKDSAKTVVVVDNSRANTQNKTANKSVNVDNSSADKSVSNTAGGRRRENARRGRAVDVSEVVNSDSVSTTTRNDSNTVKAVKAKEKQAKAARSRNAKQGAIGAAEIDYSQFKADKNGRLRNANGKYASAAEKRGYANNEKSKSEDDENKEQTSILGMIAKSTAKLALFSAAFGSGRGNGYGNGYGNGSLAGTTAGDALGMAVGGSYFLAAKELATIASEVKERANDNGINTFKDLQLAIKNKAISAKNNATLAKDKAVALKDKAVAYSKAEAVSRAERDTTNASSEDVNSTTGSAGLVSSLKSLFGFKTSNSGDDKSAATSVNTATLASNEAERKEKNTAKIADEQHEQTQESLKEVVEAIEGVSTGGNDGGSSFGMLGDAFELFGGEKRRKGGGSKAKGGRLSRIGSKVGGFFKGGSMMAKGAMLGAGGIAGGSVLSASGASLSGASTVAGGATALGGAAGAAGTAGKLGAAAKVGGAALSKLALPLTAAMAVFDGYQGYNDEQAQKSTFNLKDGEQASTGQKMAMAGGNILSLGGLTEMVGVSSGDIAKAIHKTFSLGEDQSLLDKVVSFTPLGLISSGVKSLFSSDEPESLKEVIAAKATDGDDLKAKRDHRRENWAWDSAGDIGENEKHKRDIEALTSKPADMLSPNRLSMPTATQYSAKSVTDIEELESLNSLNVKKTDKSRHDGPTNNYMTDTKVVSDPEMVRLLKSIDGKIGKQADEGRKLRGLNIPIDFSDMEHRRQANNLG